MFSRVKRKCNIDFCFSLYVYLMNACVTHTHAACWTHCENGHSAQRLIVPYLFNIDKQTLVKVIYSISDFQFSSIDFWLLFFFCSQNCSIVLTSKCGQHENTPTQTSLNHLVGQLYIWIYYYLSIVDVEQNNRLIISSRCSACKGWFQGGWAFGKLTRIGWNCLGEPKYWSTSVLKYLGTSAPSEYFQLIVPPASHRGCHSSNKKYIRHACKN